MEKLIKPSFGNDSYILSNQSDHYDISETQIKENIKYFRIYQISTIEDENFDGVKNKNISNFFEVTDIDDFTHWFIIALTNNNKYYVIQKGKEGISITYFDDEDEAKNSVRENYHYNDIYFMEEYEIHEKINIKNIFDFVKNECNIIVDKSQDFVRYLINHYYFK